MRAAEAMTSPVITVSPQTALDVAARLLVRHAVNTLPVTDTDGRLVGVVTETDIFRALALRMGIGLSPTGRLDANHVPKRIGDIAHRADVWVKPEDDVSLCLLLMVRSNGRSLLVVERGSLVGIITRREALSVLSTPGALDAKTARARIRQGQLPEAINVLASR
jgi:CBS domain-containing protein